MAFCAICGNQIIARACDHNERDDLRLAETEFGTFCDLYERNVWGPYDPDDGWLHTSDQARAFALSVVRVIASLPDETVAEGDARIDELLWGVRGVFDQAVNEAREIVADHPDKCGFQPHESPDDFAPRDEYGGDSARANSVARSVANLMGYFKVPISNLRGTYA